MRPASVSLGQLDRLLEEPGAQVFDLRDEELYRLGHIPGARHAPFAQIAERLAGMDREKPVYFVCHIGEQRSVEAARLAREELGFQQAFFLEGGTKEWAKADLPLEGDWSAARRSASGPAAVPAPERAREK